MRPGSVRDPDSVGNLHQTQKRIIRRVEALEAGGAPEGGGATLQALQARIDRIDGKYKAQIETLRGQVLSLSSQVAHMKAKE